MMFTAKIVLVTDAARGEDGLLMAGKCLSATHEAVASTRVIPICMGGARASGRHGGGAGRQGRKIGA